MFDLIPFESRSENLFDAFDRIMKTSFWSNTEKEWVPCRTDILDSGDKFVLKADMPGFRKEEIGVDVEGGKLVLTAEHREEIKDDKKDFIRRERKYGALSRSFDIQGIDASKITAAYQDGVLELNLPKLADGKEESRKIQIQ